MEPKTPGAALTFTRATQAFLGKGKTTPPGILRAERLRHETVNTGPDGVVSPTMTLILVVVSTRPAYFRLMLGCPSASCSELCEAISLRVDVNVVYIRNISARNIEAMIMKNMVPRAVEIPLRSTNNIVCSGFLTESVAYHNKR